ncbi:MAG: CRISPR-associated endoribonuclease Cas6 [Flavisolibacter sp.]|nr:CRISPR-associated endoribonuclease Cas6 [Flavisolibacter sp.]
MRLKLTLHTNEKGALLPFNYQYPLSAAIYKIIQTADHEFAAFLHDQGYGEGHKSFKLFTFSDLRTPFEKAGDRMRLLTHEAELIVCFYVPQAAENFIKGLFMNQQLPIADDRSKTVFQVHQVENLPESNVSEAILLLQPLSPLVVGRKNDRGHYDYRSPEDADFVECLLYNWLEKWRAVHGADGLVGQQLKEAVSINVRLFPYPPQQRLITIKGGTDAETKVRGFMKFLLEVAAPKEMVQLALGAGLGLHNAQGMGCVGIASVHYQT